MSALADVQSLDQSADIFVYEVSGYDQKNKSAKIRLANQVGVSFGGPCIAAPIIHDVQEISSVGTQPRISLSVGDTNGMISAMVDSIDGLEGAIVKILRTKVKYLDNSTFASTTQGILQQSTFIVARVTDFIPLNVITVDLQQPIDYGNIACPSRVAHTRCTAEYRKQYCTYTGTAMFTLAGQPTLDPAQDVCGKQLKDCKLRFGSGVLPYSGFPSLQRR